jgi:hypothetical protein
LLKTENTPTMKTKTTKPIKGESTDCIMPAIKPIEKLINVSKGDFSSRSQIASIKMEIKQDPNPTQSAIPSFTKYIHR